MLFGWLKRKTGTESDGIKEDPFRSKLPPPAGDWSDFTKATGWPSIKVVFDTELNDTLTTFATFWGKTQSECLRDILFMALYGRFVFAQLWQAQRGMPKPQEEHRPFNSLSTHPGQPQPEPTPKKTHSLRLFVPERMRQDIRAQAEKQGVTVSEYCRGVTQVALRGVVGS